MEEHQQPPAQTPVPELVPQPPAPVSPPPVHQDPMTRIKEVATRYKAQLAMVGIVLVILFISTLFAAANRPKTPPVTVRPTPTPLATPTPIREMSSVASESAFLQFADAVASLSASIQKVNIYDSTLTPPVLDLPLGFK